MGKLAEKLRWRIVTALDDLPNQCWSDLAEWAGRWFDDGESRYGLPWRPIREGCRNDAARVGSCYCNKLQREPEPERVA